MRASVQPSRAGGHQQSVRAHVLTRGITHLKVTGSRVTCTGFSGSHLPSMPTWPNVFDLLSSCSPRTMYPARTRNSKFDQTRSIAKTRTAGGSSQCHDDDDHQVE